MLFFNDTRIERVNAGGTDLQYVFQGDDDTTHEHLQFCRIPTNYLTKNLALAGASVTLADIAILTVQSGGTRSPADKIQNYCYIDASAAPDSMRIGKKYAFLIATSGERAATRNLSDGTPFSCRGYNSGYLSYIDNLTINNIGTGNYYVNANYNIQGCFEYNPKTIVAGNGSSAFGHLLAKNTYNVSDPGKGGIKAYIYEYTALKSLFAYALARNPGNSKFVFNETVYAN
jgi:hypothetical protein